MHLAGKSQPLSLSSRNPLAARAANDRVSALTQSQIKDHFLHSVDPLFQRHTCVHAQQRLKQKKAKQLLIKTKTSNHPKKETVQKIAQEIRQ